MKRLLLPIAFIGCLLACKNPDSNAPGFDSSVNNTSDATGVPASSDSGSAPVGNNANTVTRCYQYTANRDTIYMKLTQTSQSVSGQLIYDWNEKDRNEGTFNGILNGDTLVADYAYQSEGKASVREEIWLRRGGEFIIGTGPTAEKDGKQVFTNRNGVQFNQLRLTLTNCRK